MEERDEKEFFNALHTYIQQVITENPSGAPLLNVTEGSARVDMVRSLEHHYQAKN